MRFPKAAAQDQISYDSLMSYTIRFPQLNKTSVPAAGGKDANLGEMPSAGFSVPAGFVLTTKAYDAARVGNAAYL